MTWRPRWERAAARCNGNCQAAGIGYQELVKRYRIRHAKMLLRETRPNIKAIAYILGFKDAGSFRRAFREWTGESVGSWQQSASARTQPSSVSDSYTAIR